MSLVCLPGTGPSSSSTPARTPPASAEPPIAQAGRAAKNGHGAGSTPVRDSWFQVFLGSRLALLALVPGMC